MIAEAEEKEVLSLYDELRTSCTGCSADDLQKLDKAYQYALNAYKDERKETGELKIMHSFNVALIVSKEIGLRAVSVIAALLHDIIDSPEEEADMLEDLVGSDVLTIIKGFKKISALHSEKMNLQSENFRSLFLSSVDDVRIIFIKLAHRLYDMRIYDRLSEKYKKWFLSDVKYLYIPIAHRLGLYQIKAELEDLEFKYTNPSDYKQIVLKLNESVKEQEKYIQKFILPIRKELIDNNIGFEIKSRTKTINSIRKKMIKQNVDLDQVYDLFAIRVILSSSITKEEITFVDEFQNAILEKGDLRLSRKMKGMMADEADILDFVPDYGLLDADEKEKRKAELSEYEAKRNKYKQLMHQERTACWQAYSLITNIYPPNPKRLRDWISKPKASGYESLHTTVLGPDNRYVEVQIRTRRMDDHAEKGSAAHWRYKESAYGKDVDSWMSDIRNVLDSLNAGKLDDGNTSKIHASSDKIYVFTPEGDLRELRTGATLLDFAFDIHSKLGSTCSGGRVNGKAVPIRHELKNGDRVEIMSSKKQKPNPDWLKYVVTSKAKSRINRALREEKFKEAESGKEILNRKFKNWKIEVNDQKLNKICKHFGFKKHVDLYFNIALEKVDMLDIKRLFQHPDEIEAGLEHAKAPFKLTEDLIESQSEKDQGYILIEAGVSNLNYSLSKCCNPIAGDRIFGFVTVKSGIKIHRYDCPNASLLREKYPYRIIKSRWKESKGMQFFVTSLRLQGSDRLGLVNDITRVISNDLKVNMKDISFKTEGSSFEGVLKVQVRDVQHLGFLRQKLLKIKGISKVSRIDK